MKKIMKISAVLIFMFVVFNACDKDDATPDVKTHLLSKTWNIESVSHPSSAQALAAALLEAMYEGQTYTFNSNGTFEGLLFGLPNSGTWELSADSKTLTVDGDAFQISVTSNSVSLTDDDGFVYTYK